MDVDPPCEHDRASIEAIELDLWDRAALLDRAVASLERRQVPMVIASVNLDHVYHFSRHHVLPPPGGSGARWTAVLDGRPVAWVARRRLGVRAELLPGSELLSDLLRLAGERHLRVVLVGGSDETRAAWPETLRRLHRSLEPVGSWAVSWSWLDRAGHGAQLAADVRGARPDVIVVSLGKPRQELWLRDHFEQIGASLALPFGSAVDYLTGTATRPSPWAAEHGMEWLVRLVKEPRRLWRRYLVQAPIALVHLARLRSIDGDRAKSAESAGDSSYRSTASDDNGPGDAQAR
jgi:N-acetylglucosaminyldiphosphoundecaprenol N-acetyl-beta-D-mannosaminyltransferase